jgi:hypothetical protein
MSYLRERGQRSPAHSLCGRVWREQLRMRLLQPAQLIKQEIVLFVGDLGPIEDVVCVVVPTDAFTQRVDARPGLVE